MPTITTRIVERPRMRHLCCECNHVIDVGERHRYAFGMAFIGDKPYSVRYCMRCSEKYDAAQNGDGARRGLGTACRRVGATGGGAEPTASVRDAAGESSLAAVFAGGEVMKEATCATCSWFHRGGGGDE